jgi:AcrR family transcriptional regulator
VVLKSHVGHYDTIVGMSIPYELTGRTEQKARTRAALIAATRDLLAQGVTPTVEQAAASASISRTTAYRYFPNQRALLVAAHPEIETQSLLGPSPPADAAARLEIVTEAMARLFVDTEPELRTMLRLSLERSSPQDEKLPLRQGRAIGWLEDALAPLRAELPEAERRRLVLAIRCAVGIEALVWLTDVAGLSREEAVEVMRWSARALFRSAVAGTAGAPEPSG